MKLKYLSPLYSSILKTLYGLIKAYRALGCSGINKGAFNGIVDIRDM